MHTGTETSIARLLAETGTAHGDDATHLLEHGLPDLLPHADKLGAAQLGAILTQLDADYRREQAGGAWPTDYAERLGAMVE